MAERTYRGSWMCTGCYQPDTSTEHGRTLSFINVTAKTPEDAEHRAQVVANERHRKLRDRTQADRASHCTGETFVRLIGKMRVQ